MKVKSKWIRETGLPIVLVVMILLGTSGGYYFGQSTSQSELQRLGEKNQRLEQESAQVKEQLQLLQRTSDTLKQQLNQAGEQNQRLTQELAQIQTQIQQLNQEIETLKPELNQLKKGIKLMEQELTVPDSFFKSNRSEGIAANYVQPTWTLDLRFVSGKISPYYRLQEGEIQAFYIRTWSEKTSVTEVTAIIETDKGNVTVRMRLVEGAATEQKEGRWVGWWIIGDVSKRTITGMPGYRIIFQAVNEAGKVTTISVNIWHR